MRGRASRLVWHYTMEYLAAVDLHGWHQNEDALEGFWSTAREATEAEFAEVGMTIEQAITAVLAQVPAARFVVSLGRLPNDPKARAMQISLAAIDCVLSGNSQLTNEECIALFVARDALHATIEAEKSREGE